MSEIEYCGDEKCEKVVVGEPQAGSGPKTTDSIEINDYPEEFLTQSGSFAMPGLSATSVGKLLNALPIPALLVDRSFLIRFANRASESLGAIGNGLEGRPVALLFPAEEAGGKIRSVLDGVFSQRKPSAVESAITKREGTMWGRMHFRSLRLGQERHILILVEDLTHERDELLSTRRNREELERRVGERTSDLVEANEKLKLEIEERNKAEAALRESEERYRGLFEASSHALLIMDRETGQILDVNTAACELYGYSREELLGLSRSDLSAEQLTEGKAGDASTGRIPVRYHRTKDGTVFAVEITAAFFSRKDRPLTVLSVRNVTARHNAEREKNKLTKDLAAANRALRYQATHDGLTGLWNRRAISDRLGSELSRSMRERTPVGVVMADLDRFKEINDQYGHLAGDAVLQESARRLVASVRPYDEVGRYGGDEFLLVLPGCDKRRSLQLAERLREDFASSPLRTDEGEFNLTVSFGVTSVEDFSEPDAYALVREADTALYLAKSRGRNRVELPDADEVLKE